MRRFGTSPERETGSESADAPDNVPASAQISIGNASNGNVPAQRADFTNWPTNHGRDTIGP
jgi:hypothetical protein